MTTKAQKKIEVAKQEEKDNLQCLDMLNEVIIFYGSRKEAGEKLLLDKTTLSKAINGKRNYPKFKRSTLINVFNEIT